MLDSLFQEARQKMERACEHLRDEYSKLQTGRASAAMVDGVMVEVFGSMMPLKALASISIPESNQIAIQPWDRGQLASIEKAIANANLGLNPRNDGVTVRLTIPQLTEERRKDMVKTVHRLAEECRISIRNSRQDSHGQFKQLRKDSQITEDDQLNLEKRLQKMVDDFNQQVELLSKKKEEDVMKV